MKILPLILLLLAPLTTNADPLNIQYKLNGKYYEAAMGDVDCGWVTKHCYFYNGSEPNELASFPVWSDGLLAINDHSGDYAVVLKIDNVTAEYNGMSFDVNAVGYRYPDILFMELVRK